MSLETINPANGILIKSYEEHTIEEINEIINACHKDQLQWKLKTYAERKTFMQKAADILREGVDKYAEILTLEMGKPIKQARAEVEKCAWVCEYYANNTEEILKKEIIETDAAESYVQFDPLGIVLAVMPWNFPFWQVFRFAAPALMQAVADYGTK